MKKTGIIKSYPGTDELSSNRGVNSHLKFSKGRNKIMEYLKPKSKQNMLLL